MVKMEGTYERSAAENCEAFLHALGVGTILKKKAATATPLVMTVTGEDGQWKSRYGHNFGKRLHKNLFFQFTFFS